MLIFLHGSGSCKEAWQYQSRSFDEADAVDLPGHPDGEPCACVEAYVDWLDGYLAEKGYGEVVLIGHSLGSAIAQLYALTHPHELTALILVGGGARLRVNPMYLDMLEAATEDEALFEGFLDAMLQTVSDEAFVAPVRRRMKENGAAVFLSDMKACDAFDIMERVHESAVPTLAVCGSEDMMTPPKYSQYLAERMPNAQAVIIEGGTHMVFAEKPDEVNRAIAAFLRSIK